MHLIVLPSILQIVLDMLGNPEVCLGEHVHCLASTIQHTIFALPESCHRLIWTVKRDNPTTRAGLPGPDPRGVELCGEV